MRLVAGFPMRRPGFDPGSGQVGFVVGKVAFGQVFSEYFGFFYLLSFIRNAPYSSSGTTISQFVADVPSGLSLTPSHEIKAAIETVTTHARER
jgi:hypothetical protein